MKKTGLIIIVMMILSSSAMAQAYKMGAGIRFSTSDAIVSNSISFKYFFNPSISGEALFSFGDPLAFGILIAKHKPIGADNFTFFYGGGAYVGASSTYRFGLQGVTGLDYKIANLPINLSLDWKPELNLASDFTFEPAALGLSARFTIK